MALLNMPAPLNLRPYNATEIPTFRFNGLFSRWIAGTGMDFIGAKGVRLRSGGDNRSYKMCKASVEMSPPTPNFLQAGCCTNVKALKGKRYRKSFIIISPPS